MTALTYLAADGLSPLIRRGDQIVVTRLDHEANISPWRQLAERTGAEIRWVDFNPENGCQLDPVSEVLTDRTRLVAITHASNALGVIPDVAAATAAAREVGALVYVDAVHFAAHGVIDMAALDCDFLACSAYKFHGPHVGVLAIGPRAVELVIPDHLAAVAGQAPGCWERGTPSFELLAGATAAVEYLASLGIGRTRREQLVSGISQSADSTDGLVTRLLEAIESMDHIKVFGPTQNQQRTPTIAIEVDQMSPQAVAEQLGRQGIFTWPGHNYALEVMRRLGRLDRGGLLRIGMMHYNTGAEIELLVAALDDLQGAGLGSNTPRQADPMEEAERTDND